MPTLKKNAKPGELNGGSRTRSKGGASAPFLFEHFGEVLPRTTKIFGEQIARHPRTTKSWFISRYIPAFIAGVGSKSTLIPLKGRPTRPFSRGRYGSFREWTSHTKPRCCLPRPVDNFRSGWLRFFLFSVYIFFRRN